MPTTAPSPDHRYPERAASYGADNGERAIREIAAACAREARVWRMQAGIVCGLILVYGGAELLDNWVPRDILLWLRVTAFAGYIATFWCFGVLSRASRGQIAALERAVAANDVRLIGPLLEALPRLSANAANTRKQVAGALAELLPQVRASDAALFTPEDRARLVRQLRDATLMPLMQRDIGALGDADIQLKDQRLALAMLAAVEQVGGEEAVAEVERLSRAEARTAEAQAVRERAAACLEALRTRCERERIGRTLLRAVDAGTSELLRPAATVEAEANVLVRPAEDEEEG